MAVNKQIDFVLFWDKDIFLATKLRQIGLKIFNSPEAIYLCDDKAMTIAALDQATLPTPRYYVFPLHYFGNIYDYYASYQKRLFDLGFPLVIKERFGSYGDQVYLARNEEELKVLLKKHGTKKLLAEEFLFKHSGSDYRVNVVGDEVVSVVKRSNRNDFRSNINQGGTASEVEVSEDIKKLALNATKAVHGHFAGVDIMLDNNDKPTVIEVNSNMRSVGVNKVTKSDLTTAILKYIIKEVNKTKENS